MDHRNRRGRGRRGDDGVAGLLDSTPRLAATLSKMSGGRQFLYPRNPLSAMAARKRQARVTGLGGIFFKAKDPKAMVEWYGRHLGMDIENSMVLFSWRGGKEGKVEGHTVWSIFPGNTKYFGEDGASFI